MKKIPKSVISKRNVFQFSNLPIVRGKWMIKNELAVLYNCYVVIECTNDLVDIITLAQITIPSSDRSKIRSQSCISLTLFVVTISSGKRIYSAQ